MTEATTTNLKDEIDALLAAARTRLAEAEAVAAILPMLKRDIRVLERSRNALDDDTAVARPAPGEPPIRERIRLALIAAGGEVIFGPNKMLKTIHGLVGGNKNSVQVEILRMKKAEEIEMLRNADDRPVGIRLVDHEGSQLTVPGEALISSSAD